MDASESTPSEGESVGGVTDGRSGFWVCRQCGNVVLRRARPIRCYCCRTGETESLNPEDRERLYRFVEDVDVPDVIPS